MHPFKLLEIFAGDTTKSIFVPKDNLLINRMTLG